MAIRATILSAALLLARSVYGQLQVDLNNTDSVKAAAKVIASQMVFPYYTGNQPGQAPGPLPWPAFYWWEAGAMWGSLIDYWYYTGDTTYNDLTTQALVWQASPSNDFMPSNQTKQLGNDDQAFWGLAAMTAAETKFPNPKPEDPQWLELAQGVFNSQALRWDDSTCNGGLLWQIFWFNAGYNYKNSISNGCFFNLAARLGAYTQNETYFYWANKMWDWMDNVGLISEKYNIWDGTDSKKNCSDQNNIQWTYNSGVMLLGAAMMWNQTTGENQTIWATRVRGILNMTEQIFFYNGTIMFESACEPHGSCNPDQQSFKAYLSRWMAATTKVAPWTYEIIHPYLYNSAVAAVKTCTGGTNGTMCGAKWYADGFDGIYGMRQQMSALEIVQSNLITYVPGPVSNTTGGIAVGNPNAGSGGDHLEGPTPLAPITTGDRAGAGIVTAVVVVGMLGAFWWMIV